MNKNHSLELIYIHYLYLSQAKLQLISLHNTLFSGYCIL